jgi:hypothetical protein
MLRSDRSHFGDSPLWYEVDDSWCAKAGDLLFVQLTLSVG